MKWKPSSTFPLHPLILQLIKKNIVQKGQKYAQKVEKKAKMSTFEEFSGAFVHLKRKLYGLCMVFGGKLKKILSLEKLPKKCLIIFRNSFYALFLFSIYFFIYFIYFLLFFFKSRQKKKKNKKTV